MNLEVHTRSCKAKTFVAWWAALTGCVAAAALAASGCGQSQSPAASANPPAATAPQAEAAGVSSAGSAPASSASGQTAPQPFPNAAALLKAMVIAYKNATAYADAGTLRLQARQGGQDVNQSAEYMVVFWRPNKIRLKVFEGAMVSNGTELSAFANQVPNQVIKRPAPPQITIRTLFEDEMLGSAISGAATQAPTQSFSWVPLQLLLLLAEDPLKTLLYRSAEPVFLEPAKIDQYECFRVELARPDGKAVLWIDQKTLLLRRVQFPVEEMLRQIPPEEKVQSLALTADFTDARFLDQVDESAFRFEIPAGLQVGEALLPPALLLLGKPAPDFTFTAADGKTVGPKEFAGKVLAIDFWASWCGPCRVKLPLVEKVYAKYKSSDKVAFLAVSVDAPETPDKDLQSAFTELGVTLPVARDPQQHAAKKFHVSAIPASCILGPDGLVQDIQTGFRPTHDTELAEKIEKLLAGRDIHSLPLVQLAEERKQYAAWLDQWIKEGVFVAPSALEADLPPATIAPRSEPKHLKLSALWQSRDVKSPGNMLVLADPNQSPRLLVLDGGRSVAELDASGKPAAFHPLDMPEHQVAVFLRTFGQGEKRFFAVAGTMQPQVHVFDAQWKRIGSFPANPAEGPQPGIADVQLADLDGDGTPEIYVAYFGEGGVHAASLEGTGLWANRSLSMVSRLATLGPEGQTPGRLVCTNALGSLVVLDAHGKRLDEFRLPNRLLHWVVAASPAGGKPLLAGLFLADVASSVAIGLSSTGQELWTYPLPKGLHQRAVEQVLFAELPPPLGNLWVLPGPDGSIHFVAPDGKPIDQFHYGEPLCGLATMVLDGKPALVVATPQGVEAWHLGAGVP